MTEFKDLIKPNDWVYVPTVMGYPRKCKKNKFTGRLFIQISDDNKHILEFDNRGYEIHQNERAGAVPYVVKATLENKTKIEQAFGVTLVPIPIEYDETNVEWEINKIVNQIEYYARYSTSQTSYYDVIEGLKHKLVQLYKNVDGQSMTATDRGDVS